MTSVGAAAAKTARAIRHPGRSDSVCVTKTKHTLTLSCERKMREGNNLKFSQTPETDVQLDV